MNVHHSQFKEGKKTKKLKTHTDSSSREESDGGAEAPKRKRGRPRTVKRNDVEGFSDSEVRRYCLHINISNFIFDCDVADIALRSYIQNSLTSRGSHCHNFYFNSISFYFIYLNLAAYVLGSMN